jgi:lipopolysaccharide biosynthesis protein
MRKVGLVFAEDRHFMDMGDNKSYINELGAMLGLPEVNETPLFPLGNMFWARIDAIKDIFELDKDVVIQPEPLPYDGSYMHALERITPAVVNKNGYKYVTVYKDGTSW